MDKGAVTLLVGLAKAREKVQLKVVSQWETLFGLPQRILGILCGYFEHHRRVLFRKVWRIFTSILLGSKWSVLRSVMQHSMGDVLNIFPQLNLKFYVDNIKIHVLAEEAMNEYLELMSKVMSRLKEVSRNENVHNEKRRKKADDKMACEELKKMKAFRKFTCENTTNKVLPIVVVLVRASRANALGMMP